MYSRIFRLPKNNIFFRTLVTLFVSLFIMGLKLFIPEIGDRTPYLLMLFAVILSVHFGGFWQGAFSTILTTLMTNYFFFNHPHSFNFLSRQFQIATIAYIVEGIIVSWITEMQRRTIQKNGQLASIIESSNDAIVGKTLDDIVASWNKGAEKMYGFKAEEIVGKSVNLIIPAEARKEELNIINKIKKRTVASSNETKQISNDLLNNWVSPCS